MNAKVLPDLGWRNLNFERHSHNLYAIGITNRWWRNLNFERHSHNHWLKHFTTVSLSHFALRKIVQQTFYLYNMCLFFINTYKVVLCSSQQADSLFTLFIIPVATALTGAAAGYFFARKISLLERSADFQKMLDEEQLHAHKKLYAAAKHVSIRKENPFSLAYCQKEDKIFLRRTQASEFVKAITTFLSSEDGAFIDRTLSQPLWGLRNLVYGILDVEKTTTTDDIEITKRGKEIVNYIEQFRSNFRSRFQLRDRKIININPA